MLRKEGLVATKCMHMRQLKTWGAANDCTLFCPLPAAYRVRG